MGQEWYQIQLSDRGMLLVEGKDRQSFFHRLLTQDLRGLSPGQSRLACWCTPKGKLISDIGIHACDDYWLLDLPLDRLDAVATSFKKYIITEDVKISRSDVPLWLGFSFDAEAELPSGLTRQRWVTARPSVLDFEPLNVQQFRQASQQIFERFRILEGIPKWGHDIDETHFPVESMYLSKGISYTKGCYIGQETMARLHARGGNVAHRLMGLLIGGDQEVTSDSEVMLGQESVGRVTSVAKLSPSTTLAMGMLHRSAFEAQMLDVAAQDGRRVSGQRVDLPLQVAA